MGHKETRVWLLALATLPVGGCFLVGEAALEGACGGGRCPGGWGFTPADSTSSSSSSSGGGESSSSSSSSSSSGSSSAALGSSAAASSSGGTSGISSASSAGPSSSTMSSSSSLSGASSGSTSSGLASSSGAGASSSGGVSSSQGGSSSCGDVTTDGNNCGACGHDCGGGACSAGVCQPHDWELQAGSDVRYLHVAGSTLYWTTATAIFRRSLVSGSREQFSSLESNPWALASDATTLYWTTDVPANGASSATGKVRSKPLSGGAAVDFATGTTGFGRLAYVAVSGTSVFWLAQSRFWQKTGTGNPIYRALTGSAWAAGLMDNKLYVANGFGDLYSLETADVSAAAPAQVGSTGDVGAPTGIDSFGMGVVGSTLYWGTREGPIYSYSVLGGVKRVVVAADTVTTQNASMFAFAELGGRLYYTTARPLDQGVDSRLFMMDLSADPATVVGVLSPQAASEGKTGIAAYGDYIYWAQGAGASPQASKIRRLRVR